MNRIVGDTNEKQMEAWMLGAYLGQVVELHGSIYKIRKMKGFAFVLLRTKREVLQCIFTQESSGCSLGELQEESCVRVKALVKQEERAQKGYELVIEKLEIISTPESISPVVLNNKRLDASMETILDYRPITLRNERERAIFKLQEGMVRGIRQFLEKENFTEIRTPKIVYAGAEGGANIFTLDYFGKEAYLAQSPQFYKQMMVGVFERVFEIGPVYRAEKHDTSRHLNEYTSVDFEMGYLKSYEEIMEMECRMIRQMLTYLEEHYEQELALLQVRIPRIQEIPAITFLEAKDLLQREYGRTSVDRYDFEPEEERLLCQWMEKTCGSEFVFVTGYPSGKRPFYAMDNPANPQETLSFDLLFRGIEITTGGQRIHQYQQQVDKMRNRGMEIAQFESYLMMHRHGMPPHGGLGLGLERFTSRLLELDNVREATLFPRDQNRLVP